MPKPIQRTALVDQRMGAQSGDKSAAPDPKAMARAIAERKHGKRGVDAMAKAGRRR